MVRADPATPGPPTGRLIRLDGLRGFLAVYVMLGHAAPFIAWSPRAARIVEALVGHGFAAVNLFFALSGLVIVQSMARFEGRIGRFLAARARRLLPVYFVVLSASALLLATTAPFGAMPWLHQGDLAFQFWEAGVPHRLMAQIIAHILLLQGALPRQFLPNAEFSLLAPAWSLSTEWQFYGVIAVLMIGLGNDRRGLTWLTAIFLALAVAGRVFALVAPADWQFGRAFLPNEAAYFALGIAAARLWRGNGTMALFGVALLVAVLIGLSHGALGKALPPLVWAAAVAAQRRPEHRLIRPVARVLEHPIMLWLGAISYPLYLAQEPVQRGLASLVATAAGGNALRFSLVWGPLAIVVPIGVAAAVHATVERPFMKPRRLESRVVAAAAP